MNVVFMVKDDPQCWALMPKLRERVERFAEKYDMDSSGDFLRRGLEREFVSDRPTLLAVVAHDDEAIFGHILAGIDVWCGHRVVTVLQYEIDRQISRVNFGRIFARMEEWGRAHGADEWRLYARTPALSRAFRTFYGFREIRTLLSKPFSPSTEMREPSEDSPERTITEREN